MTDAKKPRSMLTQARAIELYLLMKQHCSEVDGFAVYEGDWSDERLAKEFGCTIANVANLRASMIGRFRPKPSSRDDLAYRLGDLETEVETLIHEVVALRETVARFEKLRQELEGKYE